MADWAGPKENGKLFKQVYDYIITGIERGEWKPHDKLPSVRQLAQEFGVHRLTVFRAFQLLKQDGKAYVKEKSGYYVSPLYPGHADLERVNSRTVAIPPFLKNDLSEIQSLSVTYKFSQALVDPNLLPNLYLSEYVKQVFDDYPKLMGTYAPVQGDEELRAALCRYLMKQLKINLSINEMLITTGATQAIDLLARTFVRPMDTVLTERPTYSPAVEIFRQQGARILPVEIGPGGYDLDVVEALMLRYKPRLFYMNPTFHNPTGYTVPSSQRKLLVELAERYHCLLVEDDAFHEIYFAAPPPLPLLAYDTEGEVIHLRSFSKYVAPGLRICAAVGRRHLIEPLTIAKSLTDNGTPLVNQKIFLHSFESERMQQHMEKLRTALQIRKDIMEEELASAGWTWDSPSGGLNLWVSLPETLSVERLLSESLRQSISFVPGIICDPLRETRSRVRLSYSFTGDKLLREGIRKLVTIARTLM